MQSTAPAKSEYRSVASAYASSREPKILIPLGRRVNVEVVEVSPSIELVCSWLLPLLRLKRKRRLDRGILKAKMTEKSRGVRIALPEDEPKLVSGNTTYVKAVFLVTSLGTQTRQSLPVTRERLSFSNEKGNFRVGISYSHFICRNRRRTRPDVAAPPAAQMWSPTCSEQGIYSTVLLTGGCPDRAYRRCNRGTLSALD